MQKHFLLFILICFIAGCRTTRIVDPVELRQEIMLLHDNQRIYHFDKLVEPFVDLMSIDFVSVNGGQITRPSREENLERFGQYFDAVEFEKWDDLSEPIIRFSDDYSMAYSVVHKEVVIRYSHGGQTTRERAEYAWTAIYKKIKNQWKIVNVTSTNLPSETLSNE